jgi:hypothetical protein
MARHTPPLQAFVSAKQDFTTENTENHGAVRPVSKTVCFPEQWQGLPRRRTPVHSQWFSASYHVNRNWILSVADLGEYLHHKGGAAAPAAGLLRGETLGR